MGDPHVGITVYEKATAGCLHAHHLVYSRRALDDVLNRIADVYVRSTDRTQHDAMIHARPAVQSDVAYITKQRLPLPPDFERRVSHRRQRGEAIRGVRISLTRSAKNVLASTPAGPLPKC
jgi:hypothetical protein